MNYESKNSDYFSNVRLDLIHLLDDSIKNIKVLEIGVGYGETLYYLKEKGIAIESIGIDIFENKINKDYYKPIDKYIFGNIEELELLEYNNYFDLIILADVLEHLIEPNIVLKKVHQYLNSEGEILVSMPNIRHISALNKIFLKGDFKYEESGIFDYTHYRFYCLKNMILLFENNNFKIIKQIGAINIYKGKSFTKIINKLTLNFFNEFLSKQIFFYLKKV